MTERDVQAQIRRAAEVLGFRVSDFSQGYGRGSRRNRSTRQTKGIPDLYLQHSERNLRLWIECKGERTPVTPDQSAWHERERAAGGTVAVCRSVEDFCEVLRPFGFSVATSQRGVGTLDRANETVSFAEAVQ